MGRDLFTRPYGRFYYLPHLLACLGHEVRVLLASYKNDPAEHLDIRNTVWMSESVYGFGFTRYLKRANGIVQSWKPDWIIGLSDTYYGILAERLARRCSARCAIDAYDNYESYISWLKPLHGLWRDALSRATLVTAAGPHLAELLQASRPQGPTVVIPMAADPIFQPMDKNLAREALKLDLDEKMLGYSGALYGNRGIDTLFRAFDLLAAERPEVKFVLSGRLQKGLALPPNATWLGYVPDQQMPNVVNSFDGLLVINELSAFGTYSYPVKLYEAMRCGIPVVASDTPPARWILNGDARFLAKPGDPYDLARKASEMLSETRRIEYRAQNSWETSAGLFESALAAAR